MKKLFTILTAIILTANAFAQTVDYNLPENWMCHPVLKTTDIARQQNLTLTVQNPDLSVDTVIYYTHYTDTLVDIFYVYPTIDTSKIAANTLMANIDTNTAKFVYSEQVGIYAQFGRVFAPYYRQASLGIFLDTAMSDQLLLATYMENAYNDIDSAFTNYLKYYNKGHKIILMGHSQGADHIMFLLRKKFDNNPALRSQLVVAFCAGEPNYASVDGSRTGGTMQHIKACPPQDSTQECGCMINWRSWNTNYTPEGIANISFFYNPYFVSKGLIYQTYDKISNSHQDANYDFGYNATPKPIERYISIGNSGNDYVGFDNMFNAKVYSIPTVPGSTHLMVDTIPTANDLRVINVFPSFLPVILHSVIPIYNYNNYHIWDWQFVQNDVLKLIPAMIANCSPSGILEVDRTANAALIYPNPTNGIVHIDNVGQKIKSIKLYNSQGVLVQEYFKNDFSISSQAAGIYFIIIQTDRSTYSNKLIKQ